MKHVLLASAVVLATAIALGGRSVPAADTPQGNPSGVVREIQFVPPPPQMPVPPAPQIGQGQRQVWAAQPGGIAAGNNPRRPGGAQGISAPIGPGDNVGNAYGGDGSLPYSPYQPYQPYNPASKYCPPALQRVERLYGVRAVERFLGVSDHPYSR